MVTVQVFRQASGKPAKSEQVSMSNDSLFGGFVTPRQMTDANGEAHFPTFEPCQGTIYVNGKEVYKGRIEGRKIVYI